MFFPILWMAYALITYLILQKAGKDHIFSLAQFQISIISFSMTDENVLWLEPPMSSGQDASDLLKWNLTCWDA